MAPSHQDTPQHFGTQFGISKKVVGLGTEVIAVRALYQGLVKIAEYKRRSGEAVRGGGRAENVAKVLLLMHLLRPPISCRDGILTTAVNL